MTVADRTRAAGAARDLVERAAKARRRGTRTPPRLRVAPRVPGRPPTVWMLTPDWDKCSGGIRKQYRAVDVLNAAGVAAAVVHRAPGFACSWFDHATRIVAARDIAVAPGDVIVAPEVYGARIAQLPEGVTRVIYNQNTFVGFETLLEDPAAAAVYRAPDVAGVVVVSEDNADALRYAFPGVPVTRVRHGIDTTVFHPADTAPGRRIAYMPRRRGREAATVLALLELRGALAGWEVVALDGLSEREVAQQLRTCAVFLSFSEAEGLGLPPLEAVASGAVVVGFHGFGGRELFDGPHARAVEDGDVVGCARAVEALLAEIAADPAAVRAVALEGARHVATTYSLDAEREDLVQAFAAHLQP